VNIKNKNKKYWGNTFMTQNLHYRIKHLLEETNDAFVSWVGCMNIYSAAFASMRLSEFKELLDKPEMTGNELRRILREGGKTHKTKDPEGCWATFIADHISQSTNQNTKEAFEYGLDKVYNKKP